MYLLLFLTILSLTSLNLQIAKPNPGYTQIYGVALDKPSYEVGETVTILCSYKLIYDPATENGCATFILEPPNGNLKVQKFYEQGEVIERYVYFKINPEDWNPGESGEVGYIKINVSVEGPTPTSSAVEFTVDVKQGHLSFNLLNITPTTLDDASNFPQSFLQANLEFFNVHDYSIKGYDIPMRILITKSEGKVLFDKLVTTDSNGCVNFNFTDEQWGSSNYNITAVVLPQDDYVEEVLTQLIISENSTEISLNLKQSHLYTYVNYDSASAETEVMIQLNDAAKSITWYTFCHSAQFTEINFGNYIASIYAPSHPGVYPVLFKIEWLNSSITYILANITVTPRPVSIKTSFNTSSDTLTLGIEIFDKISNTLAVENLNIQIEAFWNESWHTLTHTITNSGKLELHLQLTENAPYQLDKIRITVDGDEYEQETVEVNLTPASNEVGSIQSFPLLLIPLPAAAILAVLYVKKIRNRDTIEIEYS